MKVAVAAAALIAVASCGDSVEPDTQAPAVSVTISPCCLVTIPGTQVAVEATATDNVGVEHVEFLARSPSQQSSVVFADDSTTPFSAVYPPAGFGAGEDGVYALSVKAYDAAENVGSGAVALTVTMDVTPPAVTFTVPAGRITSRVALPVTVNASEPLARVEIYDDTTLVASAIEPNLPKQLFVPITAAENGTRFLTARAWDRAGNAADSPPDTAIVDIRWNWEVSSLGTLLRSVVPDGLGNLYAAGDDWPSRDAELVKLDTLGAVIWKRSFGDSTYESGRSVALDVSGDVYVGVSRYYGSTSARDCVLVKYDASGVQQWSRVIDADSDEEGCAVAADSSGAVYLGGETSGRFDTSLVTGSSEMFLAKYDPDGTRLWVWESVRRGFGGLSVDRSGAIYLIGNGQETPNPVTGNSVVVVKIDTNGSEVWHKFVVPDPSSVDGIAIDAAGAIYGTGANFGGLDGTPASTKAQGFVFKLDPAGTLLWVRQFGTTDDDIPGGVTVDAQGVYVSGQTWGDFPGLLNDTPVNVFLVRYDENGARTDLRIYGAQGLEEGYGAAADGTGAVYVAGWLRVFQIGLVLKYRP